MGLTEKDLEIHAIADLLVAEGENPTLANIRKALGGGSFTTISESMKIWKNKQSEQKKIEEIKESAPEQLKDSAIGLINDSWKIAQAMANDRLKSEREALEAARVEYENQVEQAAELANDLEAELETLKASVNLLTTERDALHATNSEQLEQLKKDEEEIKSLSSLKSRNETEIQRLGMTTESLRIDVSTHKSRADELEKEKKGNLLIIKSLNALTGKLEAERDAEIKARNDDKTAYKREIEDFKVDVAKLAKERESALNELSRYKDKVIDESKEVNASYLKLVSKIDELQGELDEVKRERDTLELRVKG